MARFISLHGYETYFGGAKGICFGEGKGICQSAGGICYDTGGKCYDTGVICCGEGERRYGEGKAIFCRVPELICHASRQGTCLGRSVLHVDVNTVMDVIL